MKYKVMTIITAMRDMWKSTSSCEGITLTELLVGVVTGSIVLTAGASGFINLLTQNQDIESKNIRNAGLIKALAYIQEDIKGAKYVTAEKIDIGNICKSSSVDSDYCLVLTYPDDALETEGCTGNEPKIYYGFKDISGNSPQIWLKPGILRRKISCESGSGNWIVIADGLLGKNEDNPVDNNFCRQNSINWTGNLKVYGGNINQNNTGGFRFCLQEDETNKNNRLVRVFLYGHIINGSPISLSTITFTRSE
jgi:hypothetical protein